MKRFLALACAACTNTAPAATPPTASASSYVPVPVPDPAAATGTETTGTATASASASASASAAAPAPAPAPSVKILSIGMHVTGGPYDEETKKPYLRAVEPHYPELAKCWSNVPDPKQADVGVDLVIPGPGGHPKVQNPRSTIKGDNFLPCVVAFFEAIDFGKPHSGGTQVVSYSVRFKP